MTSKQQHVSRFLEASLLRQAEGKLKNLQMLLSDGANLVMLMPFLFQPSVICYCHMDAVNGDQWHID